MSSPLRLPPGLSRVFLGEPGVFPAIAVDTPLCTALIALQGAQLLRLQDAAGRPLLWLSPGARFLPGKAVRGGIPLCFPWFGNHPANPALPAHGFARNREWQLAEASRTRDDVHLAFVLHDDEATRALWPHPFLARLDFRLGRELVVDFSVANTGTRALAFGFALHNYFPVRDIDALRIEGLEGTSFIDKLAETAAPRREKASLCLTSETDRIYPAAPGCYRLLDEAGGVTLEVRAPAGSDAVVWNPWEEKARRLGDMPDNCWRRMVCVETGQVDPSAVRLEAGERFTYRQAMAIAG